MLASDYRAGHRDEVLSVDFNFDTTKVVSCGMDHSLKVWSLETEAVQDVIARSYKHDPLVTKSFKPYTIHGV
jgi:polycomb protein EED